MVPQSMLTMAVGLLLSFAWIAGALNESPLIVNHWRPWLVPLLAVATMILTCASEYQLLTGAFVAALAIILKAPSSPLPSLPDSWMTALPFLTVVVVFVTRGPRRLARQTILLVAVAAAGLLLVGLRLWVPLIVGLGLLVVLTLFGSWSQARERAAASAAENEPGPTSNGSSEPLPAGASTEPMPRAEGNSEPLPAGALRLSNDDQQHESSPVRAPRARQMQSLSRAVDFGLSVVPVIWVGIVACRAEPLAARALSTLGLALVIWLVSVAVWWKVFPPSSNLPANG